MVRVAALLAADTLLASVTTAWYSAEPAVEKPLMVKVVLVAPATSLPLRRLVKLAPWSVEICHRTASGVLPPLAAMVKEVAAVWPTVAVAFCGCAMIEGAALIVRVVALLVAETLLASATIARYSGEIGRASGRGGGEVSVVAGALKTKRGGGKVGAWGVE